MNQEKAREFFSAYLDGTIDPGLNQPFEQALNSSYRLRDEYMQFQHTITELDALKFERIDPPMDLHERISARVDRYVYEQKRTATPGWSLWTRNLAFAGLTAAALVGAFLYRPGGGGHTQTASMLPGLSAQAPGQLAISPETNGVTVTYTSSGAKQMVIRDGNGAVLGRYRLGEVTLKSPLQNKSALASVVSVQIDAEAPTIIALPGTARLKVNSGEGSLNDLAKAVAGFYRVPVILRVQDATQSVNWNLSGVDVPSTVSQSLGATRFSVDQRPNGTLWITDK